MNTFIDSQALRVIRRRRQTHSLVFELA